MCHWGFLNAFISLLLLITNSKVIYSPRLLVDQCMCVFSWYHLFLVKLVTCAAISIWLCGSVTVIYQYITDTKYLKWFQYSFNAVFIHTLVSLIATHTHDFKRPHQKRKIIIFTAVLRLFKLRAPSFCDLMIVRLILMCASLIHFQSLVLLLLLCSHIYVLCIIFLSFKEMH